MTRIHLPTPSTYAKLVDKADHFRAIWEGRRLDVDVSAQGFPLSLATDAYLTQEKYLAVAVDLPDAPISAVHHFKAYDPQDPDRLSPDAVRVVLDELPIGLARKIADDLAAIAHNEELRADEWERAIVRKRRFAEELKSLVKSVEQRQ